MNADRLLAHYERIADAPDAIARLRRFILDLAVRGKLVPQNPTDEPASELLKRIAKEKAQLGLKAVRLPLKPDETPFDLPIGWSWSRIGEICSKTGSGSTPRGGKEVYKPSGVPFLRSQNVYDDGLRLNDVAFIDLATHERMSGTRVASSDLLLNITGGSMGRCCLVPRSFGEANISQHVAIIRVALAGLEGFLHKLVLSPYFQAFIFEEQTGAGRGGLPKNRMDLIAVALPPLPEQHRIVAKVDELMGLCDRLEAARAEREIIRDRLAAVSLARLSAPDPETFQTDARFVLNTLSALTTCADQIKQLRQTILNLAVRGKLVPQDPHDEPASELLKRIAKEKARSGRSASEKGSVVPSEGDGYDPQFELPIGWIWTCLEKVTQIGTGLTPSKAQLSYYKGGNIPWINSSATSGNVIREAKFFVTQLAVKECRLRIYTAGSLVVALYGQGKTRGQVAELGLDATVNQACAVIQWLPSFHELKGFVRLTLEQQYDAMRERAEGGPQPNLNVGKIKDRAFPLPPLAEQRRIVAKVDALTALCNQLEASLTATATTRRRLLDALLAEALAPAETREMEAAE